MVLMVTALIESGDIERAVKAGTDDFLSKPVNRVELLKRVQNMLKFKDVSDTLERLRRYINEMEERPIEVGDVPPSETPPTEKQPSEDKPKAEKPKENKPKGNQGRRPT